MPWPFVMISPAVGQQPAPVEAKPAPTAPADAKPAPAAPADANVPAADAKVVNPATTVAGKATVKAGIPAPAPAASDSILPQVIMFAPVILVFYLLAIRPQQQQEKKRKELLNSISKGQKVLTAAGIYGTVVSVDPAADKVVVRVDDDKGVKFTFSKASIARVLDPAAEKDKDKATDPA